MMKTVFLIIIACDELFASSIHVVFFADTVAA